MLRSVAISAGLLLVAHAATAAARSCPEAACGCGSGEAFLRSGHIEDLTGCEGELPPGAPAAAEVLRDSKLQLLRAQRHILDEAQEPAAQALARAGEALARLETFSSGGSGGSGTETALPLHRHALTVLRARAQLVPEADGLRACHAQAQVQLRPAPAGGLAGITELPDLPVARARAARAEECVTLLRRLLSQKLVQEALGEGLVVEVAPGQVRRLSELLSDVRAAQKVTLLGRLKAQDEWRVVRARWLRVLFGDRLRVFNDHPDALPDYGGKARGPLPASVLPRWRYRLPDGRIESLLFKKSRLLSRTVEDPRRS